MARAKMSGAKKISDPVDGKSCYVVEFSVCPGGSRWAEVHAYVRLEHVGQLVEDFCQNQADRMGAYHAIYYGAVLAVWTVQHGTVRQFVDLHRHIRARLPDDEVVALTDRARCKAVAEQVEEEDDWEYFQSVELIADWPAIAARLLPLESPLLGPGETITIHNPLGRKTGTYVGGDRLTFGSYDVEGGFKLDVPIQVP